MKNTTRAPLIAPVVALALAVALAAYPVSTADAAEARPAQRQKEASPVAGQFLLGAGVALVTSSVAVATGDDVLLIGLGLLSPALVGGTVCWLGRKSLQFEGGCTAPVATAYLGLLAIYPGAVLGASMTRDREGVRRDSASGVPGAFIGGIVAYAVVTPLLATAAWHLFKKPRPGAAIQPASPNALAPVHPRLRHRITERPAALRAAGRLNLSLLSLSF